MLFGALLSARVISSLSFTVLACSPSGSGRGSWLLQVSRKSGCPSCFADAAERVVSPRLEVGGVSLFCARFALALRSLSRLRLFLFEARLYGYCVREGEARESTLGS